MEGQAIFRLALKADKTELFKSFPDVYDGLDYFPAMYEHYIGHPERFKCFVAVIGKQIVSFRMFKVVEGGCGVIAMGARTLPQFQRLGLKMNLERFGLEACMRDCADPVLTLRFSTGFSRLYFQQTKQVFEEPAKLIGKVTSLWLRVSQSGLQRLLAVCDTPESNNNVSLLNDTETIADVISSSRFRKFYFADIILLQNEAYHVVKARTDIKEVLSEDTVCSSGKRFDEISKQDAGLTRDVRVNDLESIAFSWAYKCKVGAHLMLESYGCGSQGMLKHLAFHTKRRKDELMVSSGEAVIAVTLFCVIMEPLQEVLEMVKADLGSELLRHELKESIVMEQQLRKDTDFTRIP